MKKILIAISAVAMISMASCDNKKADNGEAQDEAKTEQTATDQVVDPAPVENSDSVAENPIQYTESGLGYRIIKQTRGITPSPENTVLVNYTGKHLDGSVFDSSEQHGGPATFPLSGVVPGFTEGICLMPVGSTYELIIPGNLAYGERGIPGTIAPNETLVFEVQLLEILN